MTKRRRGRFAMYRTRGNNYGGLFVKANGCWPISDAFLCQTLLSASKMWTFTIRYRPSVPLYPITKRPHLIACHHPLSVQRNRTTERRSGCQPAVYVDGRGFDSHYWWSSSDVLLCYSSIYCPLSLCQSKEIMTDALWEQNITEHNISSRDLLVREFSILCPQK